MNGRLRGFGRVFLVGVLAVSAVATSVAAGARWRGSIRVAGRHSQKQLQQMAKIPAAAAAQAALAAVPGAAAKKVIDSELTVKNGYLVHEVDVKVSGQKGEYEVIVDAGTGKVLAQQLEDDDDDDDGPDDDDDGPDDDDR